MRTKNFVSILILLSALIIVSFVFAGCKKSAEPASPAVQKWTCSMHPEVIADEPGKCPKCGMDLIPLKPKTDANKPVAATFVSYVEQNG